MNHSQTLSITQVGQVPEESKLRIIQT